MQSHVLLLDFFWTIRRSSGIDLSEYTSASTDSANPATYTHAFPSLWLLNSFGSSVIHRSTGLRPPLVRGYLQLLRGLLDTGLFAVMAVISGCRVIRLDTHNLCRRYGVSTLTYLTATHLILEHLLTPDKETLLHTPRYRTTINLSLRTMTPEYVFCGVVS